MDVSDQRIDPDSKPKPRASLELDDSQINELHHTDLNPSAELDDSQINELHSVSAPAKSTTASRVIRG